MKIRSIKTHKITLKDRDIFKILDKYLEKLEEGSVLAVTSKIVAICQGDVVDVQKIDKNALIKRESEYYLSPEKNKYKIALAIKKGLMLPAAGIDESNGNGFYILWPKNPQEAANEIREYLVKRFGLKKVGVIITDSKTSPMRYGTTGIGVAHSGFRALNSYIDKPDIFGRFLKMTKANVMDALAVAAVLVMGEGDEQTPLAVITDADFVEFEDKNPSKQELKDLSINIDDDLYGEFFKVADWQKGDQSSGQKL